MRLRTLGFLFVFLLGLVAGVAAGIFVYPYIFLADVVASDEVPTARRLVADGKFVHVNPGDPIHYGKGAVSVYDGVVHLESDFEVGPGPKFHVYLVPAAPVTAERDVSQSMFVDLGRLRAFKGSQNYSIPPGLDLQKFRSVVIWCEHFSVLISPAALEFK